MLVHMVELAVVVAAAYVLYKKYSSVASVKAELVSMEASASADVTAVMAKVKALAAKL